MLKSTLAKRYARAIFESMPEKKKLFEALKNLDDRVLTPQSFWTNPLIESEGYLEFFKLVAKPFRVSKEWVSFGQLLLDNNRMNLMPYIITEYLLLCETQTKVMITTAVPFSTQYQENLIHWTKHKLGKNIDPILIIDEGLLAGFKIESDTFVYDASLKYKLHKLEKALV